jgi:hypothetical protein
MNEPELAKDLDAFDQLLADLRQLPPDQSSLLSEHLQGARFYIAGSMPEELALNLNLAESALDNLRDSGMKDRVRRLIEHYRPEPHHGASGATR